MIDSWGASDASTTPETPGARAPASKTAPTRPAARGDNPWANEPSPTPAPRSRKPAESERETAQAGPLTLPFGDAAARAAAADRAVRVPGAGRASIPAPRVPPPPESAVPPPVPPPEVVTPTPEDAADA